MRIPRSAMLPTLAILAMFCFYAAGFGLKAWASCLGVSTRTPEEFCEIYANSVMNDVDFNVRGRCGFSGARWSPDREMHRKWCLGLNGNQALPCTEHRALPLSQQKQPLQPSRMRGWNRRPKDLTA
jgi:hypothetical protein